MTAQPSPALSQPSATVAAMPAVDPASGSGTPARFIVGDVFDVLATLPDGSVNSVITSPPYFKKRAYLPDGHVDIDKEIGQEPTPGDFLETLLSVTDELWRVVRDDGTIWINLGDTAAGSGGSGGDYNDGGWREGQARTSGTNRAAGEHRAAIPWKGARPGFPLAKSVCWIPELFGASLAYGRNLLTGVEHRQWITRPPVTWCKPAPTPGEIIDKFREATELIVWAAKQPRYYFDLDAIREQPKQDWGDRKIKSGVYKGHPQFRENQTRPDCAGNPKGVPPLTWWEINTSSYPGAHYATFPAELITRPVIASCPPGGTILDPFGGSGTTAAVSTGHGRRCLLIDIDERNADLAQQRVGMFLDVSHHGDPLPAWLTERTQEAP